MDTHESTPEWDIFERIEKLETLQPTAEEGRILAVEALSLAFMALVIGRPKGARKVKDLYIDHLETTNLSPELVKELGRALTTVCDSLEK